MSRGSEIVVAALLAGCGAASPSPAPSPSRETAACREERTRVLEAMAASRADNACASAADCRVVTGPGHPDAEYAQVVFAADADALEARAVAHLETCGAFHHHEAIDAYREIEADCAESHCVAQETLVHVDPIE